MKLIDQNDKLGGSCQIFYQPNSTKLQIANAGNEIFASLYKGEENDLNKLRFLSYMYLLTTAKGIVKSERLPPTQTAAKFHGFRVYLQLSQWSSYNHSEKLPEDWGWKIENNICPPITTTLEAAPPELLNIIWCKCKITTKNPCLSNICSCKKNGLECVPSCANCHGYYCCNVPTIEYSDEELFERNIFVEYSDEELFERNIFDLFD